MSTNSVEGLDLCGDWEQANCPGCQCSQGKLVLSLQEQGAAQGVQKAGIWKCPDCGCGFLSPRPSSASIGKYYPQSYAPYHEHGTVKSTKNSSKDFSLRPESPGATLLDFGCGSGAFLAKMQNLGWKVTGLDFSPHAVEQTRVRGIEAHHGGLDHPAIAGRHFDVVTLRQVLEHLHDPLAVLRELRPLLSPGGKISISVPNLDSLSFRLFEEDWIGVDFPRHLSFFNPQSLAGLLARAGYTPGKVRFIRHAGWVRDSAGKARAAGRSGVGKRLFETRFGSSLASRWASLKGQCDCIQVLAFPGNDSGLSS